MAREPWYNENEYRDYPFLTRTEPLDGVPGSSSSSSAAALVDLPHEAIVDFGAIMGLDAGYIDDVHTVYLHRIARLADTFFYEFRTTAPGATDEVLIFTRELTDPEFSIEWVESVPLGTPFTLPPGSSSSSSSSSSASSSEAPEVDCTDEPKWTGFMVTGLFGDLSDMLLAGEELIFAKNLWQVEPARMQSLLISFARSINLANTDRTHVTTPEECLSSESSASSESSGSAAPVEVFVNERCMQGPLAFKEGYNCSIRQDDTRNTIFIGAARGAGAGEPCEEVPLFEEEEEPVPPSPFLSGGPSCAQVIQTVNGKGGRHLRITAGPGFRAEIDGLDPSTLIITADLKDFAICLGEEPIQDHDDIAILDDANEALTGE